MEYVILGLLMLRERTIYELKKVLEETISLFYSASFGSIASAVAKLLEKEWISVSERTDRGRNKKIYALTPAGAAALRGWLGSPIPQEKVKDPALTRLFFMGLLPAPERIALLELHLAELESACARLAELELAAGRLDVADHQRELAAFQLLTLRYGKDYYAFSRDWYRRLLADLKEQSNGGA